jgi:hypothetical protein
VRQRRDDALASEGSGFIRRSAETKTPPAAKPVVSENSEKREP